MSMTCTSTNKTNVTSVVSDLTTAIDGLDPGDRYQAGVKAVLIKFRTQLLELLRHERNQ